jgi:subtilisin family serine protease
MLTLGLVLPVGAQAPASGVERSYLILAQGNALPGGLAERVTAAGGELTGTLSEVGIATARSAQPQFAASVRGLPGVRSVSISPTVRQGPVQVVEGPSADFGNPPTSGDDDTRFDLQWGHDAVDAPEAWDAGYRGAGARVAVLDTGFDTDHVDLVPNIDAANSISFVPGEGLTYALPDPFSHGTHTAGTVAAADNGIGTIGVAPEADLILVKVLPDAGCGGDAPILQGIMHAAGTADADIISLSLGAALEKRGYLEPGCSEGPEDDVWVTANEVAEIRLAYTRVVQYANSQGATVIASAGNSASDADHTADLIHLPSDTPGVLSISASAPIGWATDPANAFLDYPASYTNYGQSVIDFAAPGGDVQYPGDENCTIAGLLRPCWVFDLVFSTGSSLDPNIASYYWSAGTSMAAPHVAGVAAIIVGAQGGEMNPAALERELRASADDLGKPGNDDFYGSGRVNAFNAVR